MKKSVYMMYIRRTRKRNNKKEYMLLYYQLSAKKFADIYNFPLKEKHYNLFVNDPQRLLKELYES